MTLQYEQPSINLERVTAVKTFFYDSNSATNSDILFNNWASMLSTLRPIPGVKEVIIGTASGGVTTSIIPPGTWDMTNIVLRGVSLGSAIIADDAVFENLREISSLNVIVGVAGANTVPNFEIDTVGGELLRLDQVIFNVGALATAPIFRIIAGTLSVLPYYSSFFSQNPAVPVFDVQNVSLMTFATPPGTGGQNRYGGNLGSESIFTIAGGATVQLPLNATDSFFAQDQTDVPTVSFIQNYEAADVADWSGVEPLTIQNALDRIAAALGPIA